MANVKDLEKKPEEGRKKNHIDEVILNNSSLHGTPQKQSGKYQNSFYEQHLNKYLSNDDNRPFTPPFSGLMAGGSGVMIITKKNNSTVAIIPEVQETTGQPAKENSKPSKEIELVYDNILDCYYDPETNTYYKNN